MALEHWHCLLQDATVDHVDPSYATGYVDNSQKILGVTMQVALGPTWRHWKGTWGAQRVFPVVEFHPKACCAGGLQELAGVLQYF